MCCVTPIRDRCFCRDVRYLRFKSRVFFTLDRKMCYLKFRVVHLDVLCNSFEEWFVLSWRNRICARHEMDASPVTQSDHCRRNVFFKILITSGYFYACHGSCNGYCGQILWILRRRFPSRYGVTERTL